MQELKPQERWIDVAPALAPAEIKSAMDTLSTWHEGPTSASGGARLRFSVAGTLWTASLSELMDVPLEAWQDFGGHLLAQAAKAKKASRRFDDGFALCAAQLIGECGDCKDVTSDDIDRME